MRAQTTARTTTNTKVWGNESAKAKTTGAQLPLATTATSVSLPVEALLNVVELLLLVMMTLIRESFPGVMTRVTTLQEAIGVEACASVLQAQAAAAAIKPAMEAVETRKKAAEAIVATRTVAATTPALEATAMAAKNTQAQAKSGSKYSPAAP
jgi:hypothetical protein